MGRAAAGRTKSKGPKTVGGMMEKEMRAAG
jgi:hypothetical protein